MTRITKIFVLSVMASAFVAMSAANAFAELKIGYIRPQYIFTKYEPYKNAMKDLGEYEKEEIDKLKKMGDEFQKEVQETEKKALLMSDEIKMKKQEEFQLRQIELDKFYDDLYNQQNGKLVKKQEELLQPIINRINEILMRVGKEDSYDYIFDAEGPVLYADEKYDLSDYILEELDKDISTQ